MELTRKEYTSNYEDENIKEQGENVVNAQPSSCREDDEDRQSDNDKKKKGSIVTQILLIIVIILLLLLLLRQCDGHSDTINSQVETSSVATNPLASVKEDDTQAIINELNKQMLRSMVQININKNLVLDNGASEAHLCISNTGFDGTYLKYNLETGAFSLETDLDGQTIDVPFIQGVRHNGNTIYGKYVYKEIPEEYWKDTLLQCVIEDADGKIIYDSQGIEYGKTVEYAQLEKVLKAGTYECIAKFYKYYPTGEKVGPGATTVTITVRE